MMDLNEIFESQWTSIIKNQTFVTQEQVDQKRVDFFETPFVVGDYQLFMIVEKDIAATTDQPQTRKVELVSLCERSEDQVRQHLTLTGYHNSLPRFTWRD